MAKISHNKIVKEIYIIFNTIWEKETYNNSDRVTIVQQFIFLCQICI